MTQQNFQQCSVWSWSFKWKWKGTRRNGIGLSAQTNWIVYNKWSQIYLNYPWPKKVTDRRLFVRSLQWLWLLGNLELAQVLIREGTENILQTRFPTNLRELSPLKFYHFSCIYQSRVQSDFRIAPFLHISTFCDQVGNPRSGKAACLIQGSPSVTLPDFLANTAQSLRFCCLL